MKIVKTAVTVLSTLAFCIFTIPTPSFAEIPKLISYQGKLTDSSGKPVSDGTYTITFRIYEQESGGSPLWSETQTITVQKGIFSTQIGATKDLNLAFDKPYFLGIQVGTDTEMSPRQRLSSAAYAFKATNATEATHAISADTLTDPTKLLSTGVMLPWAGSEANVPSGWLLCDGRAASRATYLNLFNVIGTIYGIGDGSTTFNLPDLRGKFPLGKDNMGGTSADRVTAPEADNLGQGAGEENHTLTVDEIPGHSHREIASDGRVIYLSGDTYGGDYNKLMPTSTHGIGQYPPLETASKGGGNPHNNMPPYVTLNWIIKT